MNKVTLIGNAGSDPEVKTWENGGKSVFLTLATSKKWKNKDTGEPVEKTTWHNLRFNGNICDVVGKYVKKGDKIAVVGEIDNYEYQDKDGHKRYGTRVDVREMELLGSKRQETPTTMASSSQTNQGAATPSVNVPANSDASDDLPF